MIHWIGYIAAFLTTACYVPQALHVIMTRRTAGISAVGYGMLCLGIAFWLVYGLLIGSLPLVLANGITLPLVTIILAMKLRLR